MAKSGVLRDAALGVGCESPVVIPRIFIAKEAALLLEARDKGMTTVDLSVDFGLSLVDAKLQVTRMPAASAGRATDYQ